MSVVSNTPNNNATPPTPAIAPGSESIDPAAVARELGSRPEGPIDPRVPALVPGFDAPFFQAGLAGYSDAAMRLIARRHGAPYCVTEALLDRTLLAGGRGFDKADLGELHDNVPGGREDHPLAGQIMGSEPAEMAAAALKMVEQRRRTDKAYRALAIARGGLPSEPDREHFRLPGGVQIGFWDPTEGLEPTDVSCGDADACGADALDAMIVSEMGAEMGPQMRAETGAQAGPDVVGSPGDDAHAEVRALAFGEDAVGPRRDSGAESLGGAAVGPGVGQGMGSGFEVIDVNLACPVKKIEKKSRGGHWLTDPAGAIKILEAVREAVPPEVVCAVKLRRSFDDTPEMADNFEKIFDACYRIGYAWTTVHARTVVQKYVGPSRWTFLRDLRQRHPDRMFFGSGDVWEAADIFRMIAYAGVTGVSVARGCIGNPWIFRQARQMLAGQAPARPTIAEQRAVLREHFELSLAVTRRFKHGEEVTGKTMRKFGIRFAEHHPQSETVRRRFIAVNTLRDWAQVLADFYHDEHPTHQPAAHQPIHQPIHQPKHQAAIRP